MKLDDFDRSLLMLLQRDNTLSAQALAAAVNLSPSVCLKRVRKLRQQKVIEQDVAIVSGKLVGRPLIMIVHVSLESERPALIQNFKATMLERPEVMQCFYVTGESDFVLMVSARSMEDYECFTQRILFQNANVRRFVTQVVMDRVKFGLNIPASGAKDDDLLHTEDEGDASGRPRG